MIAAISYKRFSSLRQAKGDSERRQTDLTEEYCRRHDLKLIDTYLDAGLSGFTGANLSDGSARRALLQAAKVGRFQPGTRLIVESLDRLSRREITAAVRLFLDILDTGLVIVTLIDGEQVFTKDRVDTDLTALIIAIVYLSRANNESKNRRERALQAQSSARKKGRERKIPITTECPKWLSVVGTGNARHFVIDKDRARVIQKIFQMSASGMGQVQVIAFLNRHHIPTFSGRPKWRPGMIGHLLANEAVLGRFRPCLSMIENGRRRRIPDPDGPIENYFPAVISEQQFEQGRLARRARLKRAGDRKIPAYTNLVPRIGRCGVCGATLHHFRSVGRRWEYLRCTNARYQECSNRSGFPYQKLETVLLVLDKLIELVAALTAHCFEGSGNGRVIGAESCRQSADGSDVDARRVDLADNDAVVARFKELKTGLDADDLQERDFARRLLILEIRNLIQGVVLQSNQTVTIHMKADAAGQRVVYIVGRGGIRGAQVQTPDGATGYIDQSVLAAGVFETAAAAVAIEDAVVRRARRVCSADGDWQITLPDPMQMTELVAQAAQVLRA